MPTTTDAPRWRQYRFVPMGLRRSRGVIPDSQRLDERKAYGNVDQVFDDALAELDGGNYRNTWALLTEAFGHHLLDRWRMMPNHANAGNAGCESLLQKLRNTNQIDPWELELLRCALSHPKCYTLRQCDLLIAILRVFAFHNPGPQVKPQPEPAPKPLPTESEVKAERERLKAERTAFFERGDELALPHWQQHHRALAALGLCG